MKRLMTILALAGVVTACSDSVTQPESARLVARAPQQLAGGNGNGSLHYRATAEQAACNLWDADGALWWVNCKLTYTDIGFGWMMTTDGPIPNSTGKAVVFGPTNYPQILADLYRDNFGIEPRNGLMPFCDVNGKTYTGSWTDIDWTQLVCTTHWRYTISASGIGNMTARFDKHHTYYPFAP